MGDATREERVGRCGLLVGVRVEGVPGELREVRDVLERDLPPLRFEGVADAQVRQRLRERMVAEAALRSRHPLPADRGEHVRGGLDGGALHEVRDAAQTAHLLAAAGAAGPAVDEGGQRGPVSRRLLGVIAVEDEDATMPRRDGAHELRGERGIVGDDRTDEGPAPARGEVDRLGEGRVRDERRHRTEGLDVVDGVDPGVVGLEDGRGDERSAELGGEGIGGLAAAGEEVGAAGDDLIDGVEDVTALLVGDDGAELRRPLPRIARGDGGELRRQGLPDRLGVLGGNEGAADRGALLPGLDGHLGDDAVDEEIELRGAGSGIGTEQGEVERVRLGEEAGAALGDAVQRREATGGAGRAGERDRVLFGELVEERGDVAGDELNRPFGQESGGDDVGDDGAGEVRGIGRGFDDDGDTCDEHRGELLEHAPHGEVERVDLQRQALTGGEDVAADEGAVLRQALDIAVEEDRRVRHLTACDARVGEERADAALDVDERVALRRARGERDLVVVLRALHEVCAELLEDDAALVERQLLQGGEADEARMVGDGGEVDAVGGHAVEQLPVRRVADIACPGVVGRGVPGAGGKGAQGLGHGVSRILDARGRSCPVAAVDCSASGSAPERGPDVMVSEPGPECVSELTDQSIY